MDNSLKPTPSSPVRNPH